MANAISPTRISHVGIWTYNIPRLRDWYCKLLNGYMVHEWIPHFCTVTFDDEHHRLAIGGLQGEPVERDPKAQGYSHAAYTFASMGDMLRNHERVRDLGIRPEFALHHGPTVSMYYNDPDGNRLELLVDVFKTGDEAKDFMRGPVFAHTLGVGGNFDPDEMLERLKAGATEEELLFYDVDAAMKIDTLAELAKSREAGEKAKEKETETQ